MHGDVRQYDIQDPQNPKLVGRVWLGGSLCKDGNVKIIGDDQGEKLHERPIVKNQPLFSGPQMLQCSLDGRRLYVTNSLFSVWDRQFYPELITRGSHMLQIDVDAERGGLEINKDFLVDFGAEPDGAVLAHEMRYPGGDCTSDIFN